MPPDWSDRDSSVDPGIVEQNEALRRAGEAFDADPYGRLAAAIAAVPSVPDPAAPEGPCHAWAQYQKPLHDVELAVIELEKHFPPIAGLGDVLEVYRGLVSQLCGAD